MNVSSLFQGSALTFRVSGEGVAIDPATGDVSIATETLRSGVTLDVAAIGAAGAEQTFTLTITAAPAEPEAAPVVVVPPSLVGCGRIGTPLVVRPGEWGGRPAPVIALQWLRAGEAIAGATGESYVLQAADDGHPITCRVVASNVAGELSAEPEPVVARWKAPALVDLIADVTVSQGTAPVSIDAAAAFDGGGLSYSVTGADATVDPQTGRVTIPTDAVRAGEMVTITASNSGGAAETSFLVTIEAETGFPPLIAEDAWSVHEERDVAPAGRRVISIAADVVVPEGFELRWYSGREAGGVPALYNRIMSPGETFTTQGSLPVGATSYNLLYWRRVEDGAWAPASAERAFEIAGLKDLAPLPVAPALVIAPALIGEAKIGSEIRIEPGTWSGEPLPTVSLQWLRDGAEIDGATRAVYIPGPEDDLCALSCRVAALNSAGRTVAETAPVAVTYVAPTVTDELFDEVFDQGTDPETVATAHVFSGENLTFAAAGAGAEIDASTGVLTIPTVLALAGETITVAASNSGGSAETSFLVTVEAADPDFPPALPDRAWAVSEVRDAAPEGRRVITIAENVAVPEGFELRWYSGPQPGGVAALSNRVMAPGETFTTAGTMAVGATSYNLLYWRRIADDTWAPASAEIVFPILGIEGTDAPGGDAALRSSVTQYGITFHFAEPVMTGQYAAGHWWAQSPVTITGITPISQQHNFGRWINGAMVNYGVNLPKTPEGNGGRSGVDQGFDSAVMSGGHEYANTIHYNHSKNIDPAVSGPIAFEAGAEGAVWKAVSRHLSLDLSRHDTSDNNTHRIRQALSDMALLTVVANPPAADRFRPGQTAVSKAAIWVTSSLDMSIFPNVAIPPGSVGGNGYNQLDPSLTLARLVRPHMHAHREGTKANLYATNNEISAGQHYSRTTTDAALALCTNALSASEKRALAEAVVQQGIDVYEAARVYPDEGQWGGVWTDDGQLNQGRKVLLVLAALLLNDQGMKDYANGRNTALWRAGYKPNHQAVPRTILHHYDRDGNITFSWDNAAMQIGNFTRGPIFHEDRQTFYVNQWHIDNPPTGGRRPYSQAHHKKPEWGINAIYTPLSNTPDLYTHYRHNQRSMQMGTAMAMWLTAGGYDCWNWPPLFDYVDHQLEWHRNNRSTTTSQMRTPTWHIDMYNTYRSEGSHPIFPAA